MNYRRIRGFLGLTLLDVAGPTGVSAQRLSLAERGLVKLNAVEARALRSFLAARVKQVLDREASSPNSGVAIVLRLGDRGRAQ